MTFFALAVCFGAFNYNRMQREPGRFKGVGMFAKLEWFFYSVAQALIATLIVGSIIPKVNNIAHTAWNSVLYGLGIN